MSKKSLVQKYPDSIYLACRPFDGDRDVDVRCHTERIVTTRKEHVCCLCTKTKPVGTRMFTETAIVDGQWCSNRVCLPCLDFHCVDDHVRSGCLTLAERKAIREHGILMEAIQ